GLYTMNNLTNGNSISFFLSAPNSSLISAYYNSTYDYSISNLSANLSALNATMVNLTSIQTIANETFVYGNNSTTTLFNLAEQFDALNSTTANLTASYNALNTSLQTIDGSIATLTSQQSNSQNEISGLSNSIATLSNTTNGVISNFNSFANLTNSSLYALQSEYINENATVSAGFNILENEDRTLFTFFESLVLAIAIGIVGFALFKFFKSKPKNPPTMPPIHEEAKKEIIKEEIEKKTDEFMAEQSKQKLEDLKKHKKKVEETLANSNPNELKLLLSKYGITDPEIINKVKAFRDIREKLDKTEDGKKVPNEILPEFQELKKSFKEKGVDLEG
ncbi:MAG: hypothetical protein ACP5MB_10960, partial [bacterium]